MAQTDQTSNNNLNIRPTAHSTFYINIENRLWQLFLLYSHPALKVEIYIFRVLESLDKMYFQSFLQQKLSCFIF